MNHQKDGTSPSERGSLEKIGNPLCTLQSARLNQILNSGPSTPTTTKYGHMEGHDAGDEDPNAWG